MFWMSFQFDLDRDEIENKQRAKKKMGKIEKEKKKYFNILNFNKFEQFIFIAYIDTYLLRKYVRSYSMYIKWQLAKL